MGVTWSTLALKGWRGWLYSCTTPSGMTVTWWAVSCTTLSSSEGRKLLQLQQQQRRLLLQLRLQLLQLQKLWLQGTAQLHLLLCWPKAEQFQTGSAPSLWLWPHLQLPSGLIGLGRCRSQITVSQQVLRHYLLGLCRGP